MTDIVGSNDGFIVSDGNNYFARGHLSPDAAFVYDAFQVGVKLLGSRCSKDGLLHHWPFQNATYYFINVAPQFQAFNNGNWKSLEGKVRKYAET